MLDQGDPRYARLCAGSGRRVGAAAMAALAFILGGVPGKVEAGLIIVPGPFDLSLQIQSFSPIGQTFTAEDSSIQSIGFSVEDGNPSLGPTDFALTVSLYQGIGTGGSLLAARTFSGLTPGFSGFFAADFSSVGLTVGDVYTLILSDTTPRWFVDLRLDNPYAGGEAIILGALIPSDDLGFEVVPATVPEPGTLLLAGCGASCIVIAWLARRRSRLVTRPRPRESGW
jgi:PEP-CTERM motif